MPSEMLNATASSVSALQSTGCWGWIIGIVVFIAIGLILFLVSKNFKKTLLGSGITGVLLGMFFFSKWVGASASSSNYSPLKWTAYVVGFLVVSFFIGHLLSKNKKVDRWLNEPMFKEEDKEEKK